jgi:uncharacterized protein (TIGR04222 family)
VVRTGVADECADREHRGWGMIAAVRESVATGTAWASSDPRAGRDLADWSAPTGPARLYLVLTLVCVGYFVVAWLLRFARAYRLRRHPAPATAGRPLDVWEIALLVGGSTRFAQVALVAMHRRRRAVIGADRRVSLLAPRPDDEIERTVFDAVGPARTALVGPVVDAVARPGPTAGWRPVRARLEQDGLLLTEQDVDPRGIGGLCVVLLLGIVSSFAEAVSGSPAWAAVVFFALIVLVPRLFAKSLAAQTMAGRARIVELRTMPPTVWTDTDEDVLTRIAVFGPEAIPDPIVRSSLMSPLPTPSSS